MSVQIVINGENANEAIQELAALSAGIASRSVPAEAGPAPEAPKTERAARAARTKPEPAKAPPAAPAELEVPTDLAGNEPDTGESNASDEPIPTDVELRELARKIGAQGPEGKAAIKELLGRYGVPNITAVPEAKRIAFKRELEALAE